MMYVCFLPPRYSVLGWSVYQLVQHKYGYLQQIIPVNKVSGLNFKKDFSEVLLLQLYKLI